MVGPGRIELPTSSLGNSRSVQLSYDPEMNGIIPKSVADLAYFFALMPRSLSFMEMTRETPFSCCETP